MRTYKSCPTTLLIRSQFSRTVFKYCVATVKYRQCPKDLYYPMMGYTKRDATQMSRIVSHLIVDPCEVLRLQASELDPATLPARRPFHQWETRCSVGSSTAFSMNRRSPRPSAQELENMVYILTTFERSPPHTYRALLDFV